MFVDIFDIDNRYRGIQRNQGNLWKGKAKYLNRYTELLTDGRIPLTIENVTLLLGIADNINKKYNQAQCEVIIYGRTKCSTDLNGNAILLGFDISGDSLYLSPIKTAFFEGCNTINCECDKFRNKMNTYGLFTTQDDAESFLKYVSSLNVDMFEEDGDLSIISVYRITEIK